MSAHALDIKEQVREASEIVDVVGSFLPLSRSGQAFVAQCPWHEDRRPSLSVDPQRQTWRCWVCGIGGDVFSFVMRREGVEFREALQMLAERAGISLRQSGSNTPQDDKRILYRILAWAEEEFHRFLLEAAAAEPARKYLQQRGVSGDSIEQFHIGFAPNEWQWLLNRAARVAFSEQIMESTGLIAVSQNNGRRYDRFKGRVLFPIRDRMSRPIAFGGRILPEFADDRAAKYVNSPETRLFAKSEQLYAVDLAREQMSKTGHAIIVEGYTDVVAVHQAGRQDVVAVLGTALGPRHVRLLRQLGVDKITLVLDGDEAGQRRTNEILSQFVEEPVDMRVLTLPEGLDPCDFVQQRGLDEFNAQVENAPDAIDHKITHLTSGVDLVRDVHRANRALEEILASIPLVGGESGSGVSARHLRQQQIIARLARQFHVEEGELRRRLGTIHAARRASKSAVQQRQQAVEERRVSIQDLSPCDRELLEIFTQHPETVKPCLEQIPEEFLASVNANPTESETKLASFVTGTAAQLISAYKEVAQEREPRLASVLTYLEDPQLKALLVELDESAQAKDSETWEQRVHDVLAAYQRQHWNVEKRQSLAQLDRQDCDDEEAMQILLRLQEEERKRQGIATPMDGT